MVMEKRNLNTPNLWKTQRSRRVKGVGQPEQLLSCASSGGAPLACNLIGQKYVSVLFHDGASTMLISIIAWIPACGGTDIF